MKVKAEEVFVNLIDPAPVTKETSLYVGLIDGLDDGNMPSTDHKHRIHVPDI